MNVNTKHEVQKVYIYIVFIQKFKKKKIKL